MPTFRSKPIEIQAVQWRGNNRADVEAFGAKIRITELLEVDEFSKAQVVNIPQVYDVLQDTWVTINFLDYIIKGTKGEFYPCNVEVFNYKYEMVGP